MEPNVIIGIVAAIVVIAVIAIVWYLHSRRSADRKAQQEQSPTAAVGDQRASDREPGRPESAEPEAPGQSATSASAGNAPESSAVTEPAAASAVATQTPVQPALDKPEGARSRIERLRAKLARSSNPFGKALFNILAKDNLSEADWEDVEDTLLLADVGAEASAQLVDELRTDSRITGTADPAQVREALRSKLLDLVGPEDRRLNASKEGANTPSVIIMVGVNGTGKTTTAGKLARLFVADGKRVMMGAADTFRAAAADQLETWGAKVGVPVVRSDKDGADPASVAFEAAARAKDERRRAHHRHRWSFAEQGEPDGRAGQDPPRDREEPAG